ncbi:hypothetical protein ID852_03460 [Xenorhabdus sp. 42]|uniref:hypothetical protein n=1 Tax=Xenorhabdus szentirmaii TaxID=290112 RepID=UPI0019CB7613|nr:MULTISPECIES: hypothetical protein [unclassified Xenorhabdus]MBD2780829.1 hypothetical protein [Xenorhabdus sp. 38]MBD2819764.1 hypothetical protein [Xenorhabdus sp. 42]
MDTKLVIQANVLEKHSSATKKFREDYQNQSGHISKRKKMTDVISNGYMIEAAGLTSLLSLIDTDEFFSADRNTRKEMILNVLAFDNMTPKPSNSIELKKATEVIETPPAEERAQNLPEELVNNITDTSSNNDVNIIKREDGSTTIIERLSSKKTQIPAMAALRGNIPK